MDFGELLISDSEYRYPYIELLIGFKYPDQDSAMAAILRIQNDAYGVELTESEGENGNHVEVVRKGFHLIRCPTEAKKWGIACTNRELADKLRDDISAYLH